MKGMSCCHKASTDVRIAWRSRDGSTLQESMLYCYLKALVTHHSLEILRLLLFPTKLLPGPWHMI